MPGRLKKYGKGADKKAGGEAGAGADAGGAASPAPPSTADTFSGIAGPAHTFNAPVAAEGKQRVGGELGDWEDKQLDVRQGVAAAVLIHVVREKRVFPPAPIAPHVGLGVCHVARWLIDDAENPVVCQAFSIGFAVPAFVLAYTPFGGAWMITGIELRHCRSM